jgi:hypothetical protein
MSRQDQYWDSFLVPRWDVGGKHEIWLPASLYTAIWDVERYCRSDDGKPKCALTTLLANWVRASTPTLMARTIEPPEVYSGRSPQQKLNTLRVSQRSTTMRLVGQLHAAAFRPMPLRSGNMVPGRMSELVLLHRLWPSNNQ